MKLKEDILKKIRTDLKLRMRIADAADRSTDSVMRWVKNDEFRNLTQYSVLMAISKYLKCTIESLLEK